jgi:transposase
MKIPKELYRGIPKKMTDEMIREGIDLLEEGNSERFVARRLGVSRSTVRIHCKAGWKEEFRKKYKNYAYTKNFPNQMEARKKSALRRYHILSELYPEEMKAYRKRQKEKIGKEYFRLKSREFRERHPNYWKRYYFIT